MCSMWKEVWIGRVKPGHGAARVSTVRQPPELCTLTAVYSITPAGSGLTVGSRELTQQWNCKLCVYACYDGYL